MDIRWSHTSKCTISGLIAQLYLTLSALQTVTDTFANSVDPDETAHNEPSHQHLHCILFCGISD